jgi:DUF1680 family protein
MIKKISFLKTGLIGSVFTLIGLNSSAQLYDYPIQPVPFTAVEVTDSFWAPRILTNHEITIPHALSHSQDYIDNFYRAAGLKTGDYTGNYPFDDGLLYMILVGASHSLQHFDDPELDAYLDSLITIIGLAQEEDGYIYTYRQIMGDNSHPWIGSKRWEFEHELSHELFDLGFLIEAGVAHYEATGKTNFLTIAIKAADCIDNAFGWGKIEDYPGHEAVEFALVKLYRATGVQRYLDLAKFFLDVRGPGGEEYNQANKKVVDQDEAVGHAVRATYLYTGMADVAALTNNKSYVNAIDKIWEDIVYRKIYITGGIGATGGNEGFDLPYELPNSSAYCETCASIGNIMFNYRMFMLHGESKYMDVLERSLYNSFLSGISLSGNRFHYANPLASSGNHSRWEWHVCPCCAANIARFMPTVPELVYARNSDSLYINLYVSSTATINLKGINVILKQSTGFPYNGDVKILVNPDASKSFKIFLRVPGWAGNTAMPGGLYSFVDKIEDSVSIRINGADASFILDKGYALIDRTWEQGDEIDLSFPMKVRKIISDERIEYNHDRFALQRGPLVYCIEGCDNPQLETMDFRYDANSLFTDMYNRNILAGAEVIKGTAETRSGIEPEVTLIPYHLWNNREQGKMEVWLSSKEFKSLPDSLILINILAGDYASTNHVSEWEDLDAIYDLYDPQSSGDKGPAAFGNWRYDGGTVGTWNWVQYNFHRKYWVCASDVYWWDDNQGITLPEETYLSYWDSTTASFIEIPGTRGTQADGTIKWDQYNSKAFSPVCTDKVRLNFLGKAMAQGILEWMLYQSENGYSGFMDQNKIRPEIIISTNITNDRFMVYLGHIPACEMSIYNSSGSLIKVMNLTGNQMISRDQLGGSGLYFLKFSSKLKDFTTEQIVVID